MNKVKFVGLFVVFLVFSVFGYLFNVIVGLVALFNRLSDAENRGYWFWYSYTAARFMGCNRSPEKHNPRARQWFEFWKYFQAFVEISQSSENNSH